MTRNITLKVDGGLLDTAREFAKAEGTSMNEQFSLWLEGYVKERERKQNHAKAQEAMRNLRGLIDLDRMPTREERNARR